MQRGSLVNQQVRPCNFNDFYYFKGIFTDEIIELDGIIPSWDNNMLFSMILGPSESYIPEEYEISLPFPNVIPADGCLVAKF